MPWKKILAHVTGEIEDSLLARIEYLIEENPPKGLADMMSALAVERMRSPIVAGKPA